MLNKSLLLLILISHLVYASEPPIDDFQARQDLQYLIERNLALEGESTAGHYLGTESRWRTGNVLENGIYRHGWIYETTSCTIGKGCKTASILYKESDDEPSTYCPNTSVCRPTR